MRFSTKLSVLLFAVILLIGAGISYFVYVTNVKTLEAYIEDRLKNQAFHTMDKIDMMLFERFEDIKVLSSDPVIMSGSAAVKQLTQRLMEFKNSRGYDSLAFYNINKVCIADTSGRNTGEKHSSPEIWRGIEENRDIFMAVVKSDFLKKAILRFTSVVKDTKGTPIGFIVSRMPIKNLHDIVKQAVGIYHIEKDFEVELIDKNGLLLYSLDSEYLLKNESLDWDAIKALRSKGLITGAIKLTNPKEKRGEELLVFAREKGYRSFKGNDWTLKLEVPTKVAFASAVELRNRILVISIILSLFVFVIARLFSGRITRPIERLSAASEEVSKGNLDIKVDVTAADETGRLTETFNRMTTDLKEQRDKLLSYSSELEKEKTYLENLHNTIGDAVFSVKIPERVIEFANRSVESIFGYKPEEMLGRKTIGFYPDEKAYLDFGKKLNDAIEKGENILHTEHMLKRKNGEIFPAEITVTFLMENGENTKVVSIVRDITERKKAEKDLRLLGDLIDKSNDAFFIVDAETSRIVYVSETALTNLGYTREELQGMRVIDIETSLPDDFVWAEHMRELDKAGSMILEGRHKRKDGTTFPIEASLANVLLEGGQKYTVAVVRDITEHKKAKEALQKTLIMAEAANIAKSEFLANMSHELRTPLNHIIGFSEIIHEGLTGTITDKQKEYLGNIKESGIRLLSLIKDVLELSRIEIGQTEPELKEFNIRPVLEDCLALFREKALKHNINTSLEIEEGVEIVTADEKFMKQILVSLLSNAFKFTPDGGSVRVSARKGIRDLGLGLSNKELLPSPQVPFPDVDFYEINVADTGLGIAKEDMEKLFVPFQQLEPVFTKKHGGTGVGLYLAKRLVELHNGRIWAESEIGKGSKFSFVIPVRQGQGSSNKWQGAT